MSVYSGTLSRFGTIFHVVLLELNIDIHTENVNQAVSYLRWYFFLGGIFADCAVSLQKQFASLVMTNVLSPSIISTSAG
jgi:hypothetical protein